MQRTSSIETTLTSEIANEENVLIAPGQGKKTVSTLSNKF